MRSMQWFMGKILLHGILVEFKRIMTKNKKYYKIEYVVKNKSAVFFYTADYFCVFFAGYYPS